MALSVPALDGSEAVQPPTPRSELSRRWESLKNSDGERHELMNSLFKLLKESDHEQTKLNDELDDYRRQVRYYKDDVKRLEQEKKLMNDKLELAPFVLVLVDGDNTNFLDAFVQAGAQGSARAARKLQQFVTSYLRENTDTQAHRKIVVRVYANLEGLIDVYEKSGIVADRRTARMFFRSFNAELPLCEFIDSGGDNQSADNKIFENLELYRSNAHCKHIMLAGSADRGYVGPLRRLSSSEPDYSAALTLIEAVPFPRDFRELAERFRTVVLGEVFRDTKISIPEAAMSAPRGYAAVTAAGPPIIPPTGRVLLAAPSNTNTVRAQSTTQRLLKYNQYGQRIDDPLPACDEATVRFLQAKKPCNRYFLTHCNFENCYHSHQGQLDPAHKSALIVLARRSKCYKTDCDDRACVASHHCGPGCVYGGACKFSAELHRIDMTVTNII